MSDFEPVPRQPMRNPTTRASFRRQVWLQIYLPFGLGVAALGVAATLLWGGALGDVSAWADASLLLLILPVLVVSLIPMALAAVLIYAVSYVIGWLPGPAYEAQQAVIRVRSAADRAMHVVSRPTVYSGSVVAALRSGIRHLLSVFRKGPVHPQ
jgi:hypothetical protein